VTWRTRLLIFAADFSESCGMGQLGGRRPGAGRPKGSRDKKPRTSRNRRAEVLAAAHEAGLTPLAYMLAVMNDETQPVDRRDRMAVFAAQWVHAKPLASGRPLTAFEMSTEELVATIARQEAQMREREGLPQLTLAVDNNSAR